MKQFLYIIGIMLVAVSCDKVDCPYPEGGPTSGPGTDGESFIGTLITDSVIDPANASGPLPKNVLLEDFTGFKCINCPEAHDVAHDLLDIYGDRLNIIAVHASSTWAEPNDGAVFPEPFSQDLRTPAGEEYVSTIGVFSFPSGFINRNEYSGFEASDVDAWPSLVAQEMLLESDVNLDIQNAYFENDTLDLNFSFEFINSLEGEYFFTLALVENELITAQDLPGSTVFDYVQKDVFRGSLNGTFGEQLASDPQALDLHIVEGHYYLPGSFANPNVPNPDIEIEDCHVVIYLYKQDAANGGFSVIQVDKLDVSF